MSYTQFDKSFNGDSDGYDVQHDQDVVASTKSNNKQRHASTLYKNSPLVLSEKQSFIARASSNIENNVSALTSDWDRERDCIKQNLQKLEK